MKKYLNCYYLLIDRDFQTCEEIMEEIQKQYPEILIEYHAKKERDIE